MLTKNENDVSEQFRDLRTQAFSGTFDRVVWLNAAALFAIFTGLQQGACARAACGQCRIAAAVWMLATSLLVTLCVPMWRAMVNRAHTSSGKYRVAWEIYWTQLVAALLTGIGIMLAVSGFATAALP